MSLIEMQYSRRAVKWNHTLSGLFALKTQFNTSTRWWSVHHEADVRVNSRLYLKQHLMSMRWWWWNKRTIQKIFHTNPFWHSGKNSTYSRCLLYHRVLGSDWSEGIDSFAITIIKVHSFEFIISIKTAPSLCWLFPLSCLMHFETANWKTSNWAWISK